MIHILGGGIAGLTLAEILDERGITWRLYEKAATIGTEASGKNAGIVRTYETDPVLGPFAEATLDYYRRSEPSFAECGLLLKPWDVDYARRAERKMPFAHNRFTGDFFPDNGILDPVALLTRLSTRSFTSGEILFNFSAELIADSSRIVQLKSSGTTIPLAAQDTLVAACGEGSVMLAAALNRPLALISHQRTLFEFANSEGYRGPVQWDEESGCYFRPWLTNLLATAGEQIPSAVSQEQKEGKEPDDKILATLEKEFPFLNKKNLLSWRSCHRLMPLDNRPYCGRDSMLQNLFWFTGLGGRGISAAPALARLLADMLSGDVPPESAELLSPARSGKP